MKWLWLVWFNFLLAEPKELMHWGLPCLAEPFTCQTLLDFPYHQRQNFLIVICLLILMSSLLANDKLFSQFTAAFQIFGYLSCPLVFSLESTLPLPFLFSVSSCWVIFSFFLSSLSLHPTQHHWQKPKLKSSSVLHVLPQLGNHMRD